MWENIGVPCSSFILPEENSTPKLTCKTEKDAHGRLNHRTAGKVYTLLNDVEIIVLFHNAGILAGIHPCGVITMISELFGAESKGQVYGHLHSFFFENKQATKSLGKYMSITYMHV